ncbi:MAG: FAD:protein FMN transferase [Planctomycetes bacterium]|nr:FAD:protein FMN transferase [Planctomycetota bacterium]
MSNTQEASTLISRRQAIRGITLRGIASLGCAGTILGMWSPERFLRADSEEDSGYRISIPSMGSLIEIRWIGGRSGNEQAVAEVAQSCADAWVDVLSDYQQDSECMQFCRDASTGAWVSVSESLWRMLLECDRWHRLSEGAFDAALGALTRMRRSRKEFPESAWQEARARCGWEHVELDRNERRVRLQRPGVILDFGAIGKGFVVDRIGEQLRAIGIDPFLINASGNMLIGEGIPSKDPTDSRVGWPVSVGDLTDPQRELKRLRLSRCGIATSGDQFQRYRDHASPSSGTSESNDRRTSHIVDPLQRRGLEQSSMATVITASASDADALATACTVHLNRGTLPSWLARVESELPRAEYVFQSWRDGAIAYTSIPCDW